MSPQPRSWREMYASIVELLQQRTGQDVAAWNARIAGHDFPDEASLRVWLGAQGVAGYPQMLLVMERSDTPTTSWRAPMSWSRASTATDRLCDRSYEANC
jgi:hypothetical protein